MNVSNDFFLSLRHRKLHLVLEAEGGRAVASAHASFVFAIGARDTGAVIAALNALASSVEALSDFQRNQFDQKDARGDEVLMHRLRAFVAEGEMSERSL